MLITMPIFAQDFTQAEIKKVTEDINKSIYCRMATFYGAERIKRFPEEVDPSSVFGKEKVDKSKLADGMTHFSEQFRIWYMVFATQLGIKEKDIEDKELKVLENLNNTSTQKLFHIYVNCKPEVEKISASYKDSKYWRKTGK